MSTGVLKVNLSSYNNAIGRQNNLSIPSNSSYQIGKVYGVVTTENTPTKEAFETAGGYNGIGTIFYKLYSNSKEISEETENIAQLSRAVPLFPYIQYPPLLGELVYLIDLPSPSSQIDNTASQKYYITVNLWNNTQDNSQPYPDNAPLSVTFKVNPNVKPLLPFHGDYIIQGRQGNALRFGTTVNLYSNLNEWSEINEGPITILTNGLNYNPSQSYYVEQINQDLSSIYLTSTQKIPLQTDKTGTLNNLTNPLNVPDYFNSQVILNSDRVVINSKKDEVMIFAKTNIEINTKNIINLNADERVHLNANAVFLGPYNNIAPQPVLLGNNTVELLQHLNQTLSKLASYLSSAVSTPEGTPILTLNAAGTELFNDIQKSYDLLGNISSRKVFTA